MIRVLLADDELPALEEMEYQLKKYGNIEIIGMIQDSRQVLEQINILKPDAVFLDIDMPGRNGLELASEIQELHAGILIIFVTAYSQYALEAFKAYPLDYIVKPAEKKRLERTILYLSEQLQYRRPNAEGITKIRCFGGLKVLFREEPVKFATRQAKEMLAYLICRYEKTVTREELIRNIFGGKDDKKTINLLHVTIYNLRRALENAQISREEITITGNYTFHAADGVCDYIDFANFMHANPYIGAGNIRKAERIAELYRGAYLETEDYLWAEETRTELELQYEKLMLKMSNYYCEAGNREMSEKLLVTLVSSNPLSESGNAALLDFYMSTSSYEKFRTQYRNYAKLLKRELQISPALKFREFFHKTAGKAKFQH